MVEDSLAIEGRTREMASGKGSFAIECWTIICTGIVFIKGAYGFVNIVERIYCDC